VPHHGAAHDVDHCKPPRAESYTSDLARRLRGSVRDHRILVAAIGRSSCRPENFGPGVKPSGRMDAWGLVMRALVRSTGGDPHRTMMSRRPAGEAPAIDPSYGRPRRASPPAIRSVTHMFGREHAYHTDCRARGAGGDPGRQLDPGRLRAGRSICSKRRFDDLAGRILAGAAAFNHERLAGAGLYTA